MNNMLQYHSADVPHHTHITVHVMSCCGALPVQLGQQGTVGTCALELMLRSTCRSPALFNMANDLTAAPGMGFLDSLTGSLTAAGAFTPAGTAPLQVQSPASAQNSPSGLFSCPGNHIIL